MATLAELLRQGADKLVNLPTQAQRFVTNPQAFVQLLTGKNPLPRETGFAAGATGLPAQQGTILDPEYQAYMQGYEQGEPVSIAAMATPAAIPLAKALAPKAGQMAENYMVNQGFMPSLIAYHGTPHTIKGKFDISKVGTGEGAQAYGHGMYFAEAPQVAETYRRAGGGLEVKYPKPLEELGINPKVATHSMDWDENPVNQALGRIVKGLRTTALDYPDVPIDKKLVKEHFDEYIRLLEDKYPAEAAQKKALQEFVAKEGYPEIGFGGNLYKVNIPDEYIPKMINFDKPLQDQPKDIQDWVIQKDPEAAKTMFTGASLRKFLTSPDYSKQSAEELSAMGYKGIRYLDEGSRSKPYSVAISTKKGPYAESEFATKEQAEQYIKEKQAEGFKTELKEIGTSNFVIFEPSNVKILEQNSKPMTRKEIIEQELEKVAK